MNKAFITVTPDTGQNDGTLYDNADKKENYVSRYATFKVEGGGITKSVSIEQDPNPYIYIDCGYIFSNANIQEPYKLTHEGAITVLTFDVKFANFILSSRNLFIIKNVSSLQVEFNNPVIKPQAINAGISGMKILEMRFNNNLKGVAFFLRIC